MAWRCIKANKYLCLGTMICCCNGFELSSLSLARLPQWLWTRKCPCVVTWRCIVEFWIFWEMMPGQVKNICLPTYSLACLFAWLLVLRSIEDSNTLGISLSSREGSAGDAKRKQFPEFNRTSHVKASPLPAQLARISRIYQRLPC